MIDYKLKDRSALITGASKGIGLGITRCLASQGTKILMVARNEVNLESEANTISKEFNCEIKTLSGDVRDKELPLKCIEVMKSSFGGCDILINNSGGPPMGSFVDHSDTVWEESINLNLMSVIRFTKAVMPCMEENNWGRVVNITSTLAKEPTPQMVLSSTLRAGVSAYTKAISTELASKGITVNTLCPGGVMTERLINLVKQSAVKQNKDYSDVLNDSEKGIPIGRFATPEEIGEIVTYLVSHNSRYLTGLSIMADGGLTKSYF